MTTAVAGPAVGTGRFPGPRVLAGCCIVLTVTSGLGFYGLAVYLRAFDKERGWPIASISLATTVFFLVGGVLGVAIARIIARHDVRLVIVAGGVIGGGALAVLGRVESRWQLYLVYAVFAVGFAAAGLVPATTVVTRWYHVRRSVALSIASVGLSVGGVILTPPAKWLIDDAGLATATPILAVVWVVGVVPFSLWLIRPDPATLGWRPDGERLDADAAPVVPMGVALHEATRTRFFAGVTIGYLLVLGAQVGAIQHLVKLVEERTDARAATLATLVLALMSIVARLVGGLVAEKVPLTALTAGLAAVQGLSLVLLSLAEGRVAVFASILLFGATVGNLLMLQPLLIAQRFGVRDYPRIFSRNQLLTIGGVAGGASLVGWLYDHAGGYDTAYLVAAGCSLAGAAVLWWGGPATEPPS